MNLINSNCYRELQIRTKTPLSFCFASAFHSRVPDLLLQVKLPLQMVTNWFWEWWKRIKSSSPLQLLLHGKKETKEECSGTLLWVSSLESSIVSFEHWDPILSHMCHLASAFEFQVGFIKGCARPAFEEIVGIGKAVSSKQALELLLFSDVPRFRLCLSLTSFPRSIVLVVLCRLSSQKTLRKAQQC